MNSAPQFAILLAALGFVVPWAAPAVSAAPLPPVPVQQGQWNGYAQQNFQIGGHAAYVVEPAVAAPGKPWLWRTSWPGYHFEVDLELVRCGYHLGYMDVVDLLGAEPSLDLMDKFYDQVRSQWGLAAKPALEPSSRGGLHAYRYAVRHPERVACILGDVPVMDFKSWPLKHPASKVTGWPQVMQGYGFKNDAAAMAFRGNPIDQLAAIARAKIPLRHTICLTDRVVPPEQNTLEAKRRLQKMGWDLEVVAVKESKDCEGHHFPFPEAFASARFVMTHADVQPARIGYFQLRHGLANSKAQFDTRKTGRVAFLGGSITFNPGWRDELMNYLQRKFTETKFEFISAGIPSVGSNGHAFRLEADVFKNGPVDLLFVEAAVNDGGNIKGKTELMLRSMEGVVRHARSANPQTDIVQMHFASAEALSDYSAGKVPEAIRQHEKVAAYYGCPSLDLAKECAARIKVGELTWARDFKGEVHPPPFGQRLYSNSMMRMLDAGYATTGVPKPHTTPGKPLDSASYAKGRYAKLEDAKLGKGFTLDPKWRPAKGNTRDGFVDVPALVASEPGSEFTCDFDGSAFGLFLAAGYDTCVLEFSVDGGAFRKFETWSAWSAGLHLPWPVMLVDGLIPAKHRIVVRTTADAKDRTALHVIHLLVN
ncbi:GDSL-type esterase/lipase family protein [Luteolibacter arcticus]|uniref:GDSL-type esterase/lipase family protein n=1 Tax=Luteolibacter arcticus TaxID=1581411 RepID=A0ABT3GLQ7_9BACT|nr:GDSL-type esterase/lipase family protein [Luteolibacter arcticus]MCW1924451.1 GDSL-type esterase/lipase family protein [Luteolibacter arcticus]